MPPETVTSDAVKFVDGSLNVNVIVAASPTPNVDLLVEEVIVGGVVSLAVEMNLAFGLTDSE